MGTDNGGRDRPTPRGRWVAPVAVLASVSVPLALLTDEASERDRQAWDTWIRPPLGWREGADEIGLRVLGAFSTLGAAEVLLAAVSVLVAALSIRRRYGDALFVAASVLAANAIGRIWKAQVGHPRPQPVLSGYFLPFPVKLAICAVVLGVGAYLLPRRRATIGWLTASVAGLLSADRVVSELVSHRRGFDAFPSGHASASMTFVVVLLVLSWEQPYRWAVGLFGGLFVAAVGLSRVVLGYHVVSDVLAGWLVAVGITVTVHLALQLVREVRPPTAA